MTQQVQTNGFTMPAGNPANMTAGFTPPATIAAEDAAATAAKAAAEAAANTAAGAAATQEASDGSGLAAAIAALTAALKPAEGAAPAQGTEAPTQAAGSLNVLDPASIQDPILRSMATIMQTVGKGMDMDRIFGNAIEHGNPNLLDTAYIKEKGGENAAQLISIAQGIVASIEAQGEALVQSTYAIAGGKQQWDSCTAVFNKGAPQELRQIVKLMMDSGNSEQIKAGAKVVAEFAKSNGLVPQGSARVTNGAQANLPGSQGLSKEQFQVELNKLDPNARGFAALRNDLFARRSLGKQLHM